MPEAVLPRLRVGERDHPAEVVQGRPHAPQLPVDNRLQRAVEAVEDVRPLEVPVEDADSGFLRQPFEQLLPHVRSERHEVHVAGSLVEAVPARHVRLQLERRAVVGHVFLPVEQVQGGERAHRLEGDRAHLLRGHFPAPVAAQHVPLELVHDEVRRAEPALVLARPDDVHDGDVRVAKRVHNARLADHVGGADPAHVRRGHAQHVRAGLAVRRCREPEGEARVPRHRLDVRDGGRGVAQVLATERHEAFGELREVHAQPPQWRGDDTRAVGGLPSPSSGRARARPPRGCAAR